MPIDLAILAQSALAALCLDLGGQVLALNPAAARALGAPAAALVGRRFADLVEPFSAAKAALMVERTLAEGGVREWELNHRQPAGPPLLLGYTTWLLRDEAGAVVAIAALGLDLGPTIALTVRLAEANQQLEGALGQLERAHAELKAAQALLVQSEKMRALGQLVAGVAHEINTPLGYVANNLAFLAEQLPAPPGAAPAAERWADLADAIGESRTGVERIAAIVSALRTFARPAEGDLVPADLDEGLASAVRMARSVAPPEVLIRAEYGGLPPLICRPGELNQVFLNLLLNAVQACAAGGEVLVRSALAAGEVQISVRDSGVGMGAATLARLGEPFFTTRPAGSGTGLGLAISRGIVERHGGRLCFVSAPGAGTTATVRLPAAVPSA